MAGACLVQELFVGDPAVLIEVIALPVEGHSVAMPSLNMPVQAIVREICLGTHKPLNLHWPLAHIKIEPAAVMKLLGHPRGRGGGDLNQKARIPCRLPHSASTPDRLQEASFLASQSLSVHMALGIDSDSLTQLICCVWSSIRWGARGLNKGRVLIER